MKIKIRGNQNYSSKTTLQGIVSFDNFKNFLNQKPVQRIVQLKCLGTEEKSESQQENV